VSDATDAPTRRRTTVTDDPHARGGPRTYVAPGARTPTQAERARTLAHDRVDGVLSTTSVEPAGFPFGSIVTYALDGAGAPLVLMSTMAEHARNLAADPRCSLLVAAAGDGAGRLAVARATLLGELVRVDDEDQDDAVARYLEVHPGAFWARFPDFAVHRLEVSSLRYVRGFGEMGWVTPADYAAAAPDPVAPAEDGIVQHVNEDHAAALRTIVAAFLEVDGEVTEVTMTSCDRYGFEVQLALAPPAADERPGLAFGRLGFDTVLDAPDEARGAMVRLVRAAEAATG
jgi:putative heme iron utilization protein